MKNNNYVPEITFLKGILFTSKVERNGFVINSLLDTDLYEFTTANYFYEKRRYDSTILEFKCRNNVDLTPFISEIEKEIEHLQSLRFKDEEIDYLRSLGYFTEEYLKFIFENGAQKEYPYYRNHPKIFIKNKNGEFKLKIEGYVFIAFLYEVYLLKIIHEVYSRNVNKDLDLITGRINLQNKIDYYRSMKAHCTKDYSIVDFGSRRAFSGIWHEEVVSELVKWDIIKGTSNVLLAKEYNIKPIGSMPHKFIQSFQGICSDKLLDCQKIAFEEWIKFFDCKLDIALTDTLGDDKFFKDFSSYYARLYSGLRHDSGDPLLWGRKVLEHYKKLDINPKEKIVVFSDNLNKEKVWDIYHEFIGKFKHIIFGIGTNFTNDVGVPYLQNVIKQTSYNKNPTAKLSNDSGKTMCKDEKFLTEFKELIKIDLEK